MLTRKNIKNGDELSILGFGCMRFPMKGNQIDEERSIKMIHDAIKKGMNYFDTAYPYHAGKSEPLLGKALQGGYREKVKIATKLPHYMIGSFERAQKVFNNQLKKLQTDYIDYYLIHMLSDLSAYERLVDMGVMAWLESLKEEGVIKNLGFSFHGGKQEFEELVKAYPWDFCQIQYNYIDENRQATRSGLELANELGMPVIVMEPLRGGKLVDHLPKEVHDAFKTADPDKTVAEWSLRWIWNHPEVTVILSGMSNEAQLDENIRIASSAYPNSLSSDTLAVFDKVKTIMLEKTKVPCTACGYCMPCPVGVDIPACFSVYNDKYLLTSKGIRMKYMQTLGMTAKNPGYASKCIACGKCEQHCPQHIAIRDELKNVKREMEGSLFRPFVSILRKVMKID